MSIKFSDLYIDQAFHVWYEANRPGMKKLYDLLMEDDDGHKPTTITLNSWKSEYGWEERADALDGEASRLLDQEVIQRRIEMWDRLEKVGNTLLAKGEKFIEEHPLDDSNDAIRAIVEGGKLLQASVGQSAAWSKLGEMSDAQLNQMIKKLLGKTGQGSVVTLDGDTIDGEEILEDS